MRKVYEQAKRMNNRGRKAMCSPSLEALPKDRKQNQNENIAARCETYRKSCILVRWIAIVVCILMAIPLASCSRKPNSNYALYIKEQELFLSDLNKDSEPWQITSHMFNSNEVDNQSIVHEGYYYQSSYGTYASKNGTYLFFSDRMDNLYNYGRNLYYTEVANPMADTIKIDSDVLFFKVNDSATIVTYLKRGDKDGLYQYSTETDTKEKIGNIDNHEYRANYRISNSGTKIYYISGGNLYFFSKGQEQEKIASNVYSIQSVTDDFKTVYYVRDFSLYKKTVGQDKAKLADDVGTIHRISDSGEVIYTDKDSSIYKKEAGKEKVKIASNGAVIKTYESGEIYYRTEETREYSLMDYVIDDMKESDAIIMEPTYPDYPDKPIRPSKWDYEEISEYEIAYDVYEKEYEEYEAEYNRLKDEYDKAYQAYREKKERDELREELKNEVYIHTSYSLHFFNGTESNVVAKSLAYNPYTSYDENTYVVADLAPVIYYRAYNPKNIDKMKITKITYIRDVISMIGEALSPIRENYIAVQDRASVMATGNISNAIINDAGTVLYYNTREVDDNYSDENGSEYTDKNAYADLYRVDIVNGIAGEAKLYDTDVLDSHLHEIFYFVEDDQLVYFKDLNGCEGDLYVNKKLIDYAVNHHHIYFSKELKKIVYISDSDDYCGTLKVYQDGKSERVSDDVFLFTVTPDGNVLYLYDYSLNYCTGELYEWANGQSRKIDEEVTCIVAVESDRYSGMYNSYCGA